MEHLEAGNKTKAMEYFQISVDVTPQMAHELIKVHICSYFSPKESKFVEVCRN
jgi:hypothetical protein